MSNGLGDSIAAVTHLFRLDKVAEAVAKMVGAEGCGCKERQEYLNQLFPYKTYRRSFKVLSTITIDNNVFEEGSEVTVTQEHPLFHGVIEFVRDGMLQEI
jgi:hypothetical protein